MARINTKPAPADEPVRTAPYDANVDERILAKRRAQGLIAPESAPSAPVEAAAAPAAE